MGTIYSSEAFRDYAQRQIDSADIFLTIHAEAGLSLCRCGRLHPCDDHRYWLEMRTHYRRCLSSQFR